MATTIGTQTPRKSAGATESPPPNRTIGPADNGRPMTLEAFEACRFQEGWIYELARGIVIVTEVPGVNHGRIVRRTARLFDHYDETHPGLITYLAGGAECRLRMPGMQSDRHPDQAVYLTPQPEGPSPWNRWVPQIVVEIVSSRSNDRDYVENREEYLRAGVEEYWILDSKLRRLLVLRRVADTWEEVEVPVGRTYQTRLLPGMVVDPAALLGPEAETADE